MGPSQSAGGELVAASERPHGATQCPMCGGSGDNPIGKMACILCDGRGWHPPVERPWNKAQEAEHEAKTVPPGADPCKACKGRGETVARAQGQAPWGPDRCDACKGNGWVPREPLTAKQVTWREAVQKVRAELTPEAAASTMQTVEMHCGPSLAERLTMVGDMMVRRFYAGGNDTDREQLAFFINRLVGIAAADDLSKGEGRYGFDQP